MDKRSDWTARRAKYDQSVLGPELVHALAVEVVKYPAKPGYRVTFNPDKHSTSRGESVLGDACWLIDFRRWSMRTEYGRPGRGSNWEATEEIVLYDTYLLDTGEFAEVYRSLTDSSIQYKNEDKAYAHPCDLDTLRARLDFEKRSVSRRNGDSQLNTDRDPSDRLKSFVHHKGDGIRAALIELADTDHQAVLRRRFPTLSKEGERVPTSQGTIVRWISAKGFGFVSPDGGAREVFLHENQVDEAQREKLAAGALVAFNVRNGPKGQSAVDVKVLG
ncbi:cold-shock protein [Microbacterium sp. ASV49]|uniref:Cold shock domain-containing protein n=1 Tax=Microbacterium candidum TaxID=3041922 RepID=A0ABT7MW14_9MICO|nr:cold shock domain-containing protein [Microbacterium sp. ASV49]MDL9978631.1 cold shock domain-containing protein [Microbacterium sp. ASV49]